VEVRAIPHYRDVQPTIDKLSGKEEEELSGTKIASGENARCALFYFAKPYFPPRRPPMKSHREREREPQSPALTQAHRYKFRAFLRSRMCLAYRPRNLMQFRTAGKSSSTSPARAGSLTLDDLPNDLARGARRPAMVTNHFLESSSSISRFAESARKYNDTPGAGNLNA